MIPPKETYLQEHVGMAEWGVRHRFEPTQDDSRTGVYETQYRYSVWNAMMGPIVAARIMGMVNQWNHISIFLYAERSIDITGGGGTFVTNMRQYMPPL